MSMSNKKKTYESPKVEIYGALREVTAAVGGTGMMDGGPMGQNKTGL